MRYPVQVRRESIGSAIKDSSLSLAGTLVPLTVQVLPAGTPEEASSISETSLVPRIWLVLHLKKNGPL